MDFKDQIKPLGDRVARLKDSIQTAEATKTTLILPFLHTSMTRLLLLLLLLIASVSSFAQVHVRGYYRKNGTYVQPHQRTRPNHTITDNYSYPGNYNPNTGRITGGSVDASRPAVSRPTRKNSSAPSLEVHSEPALVEQDDNMGLPTRAVTVSTELYAETEPNAALKVEPNYMANSRYAIPRGALVKVIKFNENYYRAEVNGLSGYVCACQVKKTFTNP